MNDSAEPAMGEKPGYRSRIVTEGLDRTPHRAYQRACGLDDSREPVRPVVVVARQQATRAPRRRTSRR